MNHKWSTKKIGEVIELRYGKGILRADRKPDGLYPVYGANGVLDRTDKFLIEGEAIIVGRKGSAGEIIRVSGRFWPSDVTYYILGNDQIDIDYLFHFLKSVNLPKLAVGVKPGINRNRVYEIEIPLPPIAEQRRIVEKIEKQFAKIDEAARLRAESLAATDQLLPAALHEIFSGGKQKGWEEKTLGDIVTLKSGTTVPKEWERGEGTFPYLKVGDMNLKGNEKFATISSRYVERLQNVERMIIPANSVIFPKRGGAIATNKKRIVQQDILIDLNTMAVICPPELLNAEFFYYWFLQVDLATLNTGSSVPQINNGQIAPLKIPLPPLAEQKEIVKKLDALSERVRVLRELQLAQQADLKALKQSILHEAFSQ